MDNRYAESISRDLRMMITGTLIAGVSATVAVLGFVFTRYREFKQDTQALERRIGDLQSEQKLLKQRLDKIENEQVVLESELKNVQMKINEIDVKLSRVLTILELQHEKQLRPA